MQDLYQGISSFFASGMVLTVTTVIIERKGLIDDGTRAYIGHGQACPFCQQKHVTRIRNRLVTYLDARKAGHFELAVCDMGAMGLDVVLFVWSAPIELQEAAAADESEMAVEFGIIVKAFPQAVILTKKDPTDNFFRIDRKSVV